MTAIVNTPAKEAVTVMIGTTQSKGLGGIVISGDLYSCDDATGLASARVTMHGHGPTYDVRREGPGWSVYDVDSGTIFDGMPQRILTLGEAGRLANFLNTLVVETAVAEAMVAASFRRRRLRLIQAKNRSATQRHGWMARPI